MPAQLFLNFVDENRQRRRVEVDCSPFDIGRTSDNDLQIADGALSRHHAKIERYGDIFVLTDAGSSNGTSVNGEALTSPIAIQNGDRATFGGAVEVTIEIIGLETAQHQTGSSASANAQPAASEEAAAWSSIFIIAPICAVLILSFVAVLFFALGGSASPEPVIVAQKNRNTDDDEPTGNRRKSNADDSNEDEPDDKPTPRPDSNGDAGNSSRTNSDNPGNSSANDQPNNTVSGEIETVEKNALQFLRNISGDSNPVLRSKELDLINRKIKTYKNSPALRANIAQAKRGAASIQTAAKTHGLKPAFVAAASLMKLDQTSGSPEAAAGTVAPILGKFANGIGTELANECLLVVAAMEQNDTGLPGKLGALALERKVNVSTVRTVWFLHENKKLTDQTLDSVVRFLAIGAIAQNPKDFGINAEPLNF